MSHKPRCLPPAASFETFLYPSSGTNVAVAAVTPLGLRVSSSHALLLSFTTRGGGVGLRLFFDETPGDANNANDAPIFWLTQSPVRILLPGKIRDATIQPMTPATAEDASYAVELIESNHP